MNVEKIISDFIAGELRAGSGRPPNELVFQNLISRDYNPGEPGLAENKHQVGRCRGAGGPPVIALVVTPRPGL